MDFTKKTEKVVPKGKKYEMNFNELISWVDFGIVCKAIDKKFGIFCDK